MNFDRSGPPLIRDAVNGVPRMRKKDVDQRSIESGGRSVGRAR